MIDLIQAIIDGTMTFDEAFDMYDKLMDSDYEGDIGEALGLSAIENTAWAHGVWFDELADWRKNGWPNKCAICGKEIVVENWGWFAREIDDGESHELVHIDCMDD